MTVETRTDLWRQQDIFVPPEEADITIIGAGGIGSWVALGLVKTGFNPKAISVWDEDTVELHNIPNQNFNASEAGMNKAKALEEKMGIRGIPSFWNGEDIYSDVIVIAVDNMELRKRIVETQLSNCSIIIDGRIGGEKIRVLSISPIDYGSKEYFLKTWYPDDEAVELPCTARAIADVGFFVGGIICNLIRKFYKENKVIREIIFDADKLEILKI